MSRPELSETLVALVSAVSPPGEQVVPVEVDLSVPMEISVEADDDGLVVRAAPGHTRFVSGFLPPVHCTRLRIVAGDAPSYDVPPGWSS